MSNPHAPSSVGFFRKAGAVVGLLACSGLFAAAVVWPVAAPFF